MEDPTRRYQFMGLLTQWRNTKSHNYQNEQAFKWNILAVTPPVGLSLLKKKSVFWWKSEFTFRGDPIEALFI
jgi:hypothetical protein